MKTKIEVKDQDISRPSERPPKTNWKIELIKKALGVLQYASPKKSAEIIWHFFTMPGKVYFSPKQEDLLQQAESSQFSYQGDMIKAYRWGIRGPKVLLCHGWRSKTADFRKMILALLDAGYVVEGFDLKAHGNSEGSHTALPEYRDILKSFISKNGPYDTVIGYSIGALASGIALSELGGKFQPKNYFVIAGPPFGRYFFKDIVNEVGCNESVYEAMCHIVKEKYKQPIDYFDLRLKQQDLKKIKTHLIYCEDDQIIPFYRATELEECWPHASFVHAKGLGHYKIISNESIVGYIIKHAH